MFLIYFNSFYLGNWNQFKIQNSCYRNWKSCLHFIHLCFKIGLNIVTLFKWIYLKHLLFNKTYWCKIFIPIAPFSKIAPLFYPKYIHLKTNMKPYQMCEEIVFVFWLPELNRFIISCGVHVLFGIPFKWRVIFGEYSKLSVSLKYVFFLQ